MYPKLFVLVGFLVGATSFISANAAVSFNNLPGRIGRLLARAPDTFGGNETLIEQCQDSKDCNYAAAVLNRCIKCVDPAFMNTDQEIAFQKCTCKNTGSDNNKAWLDAYNACFKCFMDAGEDPEIGVSASSRVSSFCAAATPVVTQFVKLRPTPSGVTITQTICEPEVIGTTSMETSSSASSTLDVSETSVTTSSQTSTSSPTSTGTSTEDGLTTLQTVVPQSPPHPPSSTTTVTPRSSSSATRLGLPSFGDLAIADYAIPFDILAVLAMAFL